MPASNYIPLKKLQKKADDVFSKFVRQRDADENGTVRCCTCGKFGHWKTMQAGHFLSRRYLSIRFDEKNCSVQCVACNRFNQGRQSEFREYLVKRYGEDQVKILEIKKFNTVNDTRLLYETIIERYK